MKRRARVLVVIAAGLSAVIISLSLLTGNHFQSFSSSIVATKANPLGISENLANKGSKASLNADL